jgi:hypothetical protein
MSRRVLSKFKYNINCNFINYFLQLLSAKKYLSKANIALIFYLSNDKQFMQKMKNMAQLIIFVYGFIIFLYLLFVEALISTIFFTPFTTF